MKAFSHTDYMNTLFFHCVFYYELSHYILRQTACDRLCTNTALTCHPVDSEWYHCYQLQSLPQRNSLYIHRCIRTHTHTHINAQNERQYNTVSALFLHSKETTAWCIHCIHEESGIPSTRTTCK